MPPAKGGSTAPHYGTKEQNEKALAYARKKAAEVRRTNAVAERLRRRERRKVKEGAEAKAASRYLEAHEAREARAGEVEKRTKDRERSAPRPTPQQKRLSVFGVPIPGSEHRHTDNLPARTLADLAATARDAPRGAATFGDALYRDFREPHDYAEAVRKARREGRPLPPKFKPWNRTRRVLGVAKDQLIEDVRHPLRHPGNSLLAALSVVSGGVTTGARATSALSAASRAARVAPTSRVPRVVAKRRNVRELDPSKLGVGKMVRELRAAEKIATPKTSAIRAARAGGRDLRGKRMGPQERLLWEAQVAHVMARRQRAARELEQRAHATRRVSASVRGRPRLGD